MALPSIKNRVGMTVTGTPGVGTITLNAADTGHQSFAAAYAANANVDILIEEGSAWEIARDCTYTNTGTTVTRGTLEASSTGAALSLTSAAKVYVVASADRINGLNRLYNRPVLLVNGTTAADQALASGTWTKIAGALYTSGVVDTLSGWSSTNKRYTPTVAGKYLVFGQVKSAQISVAIFTISAIYKNGVLATEGGRVYNGGSGVGDQESGVAIYVAEMNGSTDYLELYGYISEAKSVAAHAATYMQAVYLGV